MTISSTRLLTHAEFMTLLYASHGKTREEISIILGRSTETIKTHLASIRLKLDAVNTVQAVALAYERGILGSGARKA